MSDPRTRDQRTMGAEEAVPEATLAAPGPEGRPGTLEGTPSGEIDPGQATEGVTLAIDTPIDSTGLWDATPAAQTSSPPSHRPPPTIAGYTIEGELGRGAMGVVYRARQALLNRPCALKVILAGAHADPVAAIRFLAEAEAVAKLQHPGIVQIHHIGEADGLPFLELEYAPGGSLDRTLDGTPWPARRAATLVEAMARGVAEAHRQGIVHRDLKPSNILIAGDGTPKVADFGLAKSLNIESGLTATESILGSPSYMAPEQAEGKARQVGPAADIYALGAILYELLVGRPPFRGTTVLETLEQVKAAEPVPPSRLVPGVARDAETIALKCLQKDPVKRYSSAGALAEDLRRFQAGEPILARRTGPVERSWRWCRRNPTIAALWAGLVGVLVAGTAVASYYAVRAREGERQALDNAAEAERQRGLAADRERGEREQKEFLRRQDYLNRIALAQREVQDDNVPRAEDLLQGCPVDLRGWEWDYVNRLAHQELRTYRGHRRYLTSPRYGQSIQCLAFSPDGTWIASAAGPAFGLVKATDAAEIRIWDPATGRDRRAPLGGLPGTVWAVDISPDGRRIAAGGGYTQPKVEGWLTVWDAATGERLWTTPPESGVNVLSAAFSPDGKSLAAGYGRYSSLDTGHARLWDVETGKALEDRFAAVKGGVNSVSFHRDGKRVALAGLGHVEIWDVAARARVRDLTGHTKWVYCVALSPDGKRLATGGFDNTVKLWDPDTGAEARTLHGAKGFVRGLAFSPDGTHLASASEGKDLRLWDVATGRELASFHGHTSFLQAVAFHPDGRRIASGGVDGTVKLWDLKGSRPVVYRGHTGWVTRVAFRRDGRRVASETGYIQFRTGDETFKVWDPVTGEEDSSPAGGGTADFGPGGRWRDGVRGGDVTVVTGPGGRRIAFAPADEPVVHVKDAATDRLLTTLRGHTDQILCIAFSPDGKRIATASQDQTIKIWDPEDGQEVLTLRGHTHSVTCVAFSPDGHRLASGSVDTTARVWDATPFSPADLREQEARRLVPPLHQWQFKDEVIERLRADATHSAPVRAAAVAIVEALVDDPELLSEASWLFVRAPGERRDDYLRALRRAEAAVRLAPENGTYVKTLGAALYRVGRLEQALEALRRATALDTAKLGGPTPMEIAFLAMTHYRLGHRAEARSSLDQLRRMTKHDQWADPAFQAILHEAETLIEPGSSRGHR